MRLGYSTWGMPTVPVDQVIPTLARIGFDSTELTVIPGFSAELDTLDAAERRRIRALLNRHNLRLAAIAGHRSLLAKDPTDHAENLRRLRGAIDLAVDLAGPEGLASLDTTAGGISKDWEAERERLASEVGELCEYAQRRGVVVGIEAHVDDALDTPERVLWLIERVGRPNLKTAFDISHFNVQGIPIEHSVELMAPVACFTHIKDERGVGAGFEFLIPGEGEFDYVRYLKAMRAAGYEEDICVEVSFMVQRRSNYDPIGAAEQSYATVARAFESAGIERS